MTNDREPRVRELSPAEIEALRPEMREYIEWAKAILASRCLGEIIAGELH